MESNLNSTRLGIISANNWKISPFIPLFSNLKWKQIEVILLQKEKGKGKGRKENQVKPQSFQIGITLQSKWKQFGLFNSKVIRNKTKRRKNLLLLSKGRKWKRKKRFKLEFFDLGEKWEEDFKRRQFDLIVFQTQSGFLGIVCLSFNEDSVFIDLIDFLCDAGRFRIEKRCLRSSSTNM